MKNIFLIVLDSVRNDFFNYVLKFSKEEFQSDFVNYRNCDSIYTGTFNAHYAMFFGDYLFSAKNENFPAQLRKIGYKTRSFCNGALLFQYPLKNKNLKELRNKPFREHFIRDLGLNPVFNYKLPGFGSRWIDFNGTADDESNNIPEKWKNYIKNNENEKNFIFLHFWNTHHNYKINDFLDNKIYGENFREIGLELLRRIYKKEIPERDVRFIYTKRILEILNVYIYELIQILKRNNQYEESLIIITSDHGEGLGNIGKPAPFKLSQMYDKLYRIYEKFLKKYYFLPKFKKIAVKWDMRAFFHAGKYKLQREVPLLIKFPNNTLGGLKFNREVSFFDFIHTINEFNGNKLKVGRSSGCSLLYLLREGKGAREKYKIDRNLKENLINEE